MLISKFILDELFEEDIKSKLFRAISSERVA